jgi:predicted metal-dependent phosphoesterase TrpH
VSVSAPTFDLQSHSRHSDGALAPAEVVAAAAQAGVRLLALTDHDTVDGVREAAAAAERAGIRLVTGVEVSTIDAGGQDLHILGYLVDDRDPVLLDRLHSYRQAREHRAAAIVEALGDLGFAVEESRLRERAAAGKSVGRPHLAEAVVHHPANRERLATEGLLEPSAFLVAYLIEGRPAFRPRQAPSVEDAVGVIHGAGGVAVWAHPFWDVSAPAEVLARLERFVAAGLDGVECFYPTHSPEQAGMLADRCAELGLLSTGSADFHGPRHREFSHFRAFSTYGHEAALGPIAG